jgi:hypothetical protein
LNGSRASHERVMSETFNPGIAARDRLGKNSG